MMQGLLPLVGIENPPSTTLLVQEVENGYVIDVDLEGEIGKYFRRVKFVADTIPALEGVVVDLLKRFELRSSCIPNHIPGGGHPDQMDRRMVTITRMNGGYIIGTMQPIQVKIDPAACSPARLRPGSRRPVCTNNEEIEEYTDSERIERIIISMDEVMKEMTLFFGKKAE